MPPKSQQTTVERLRYMVNHCAGFMPTRYEWEEVIGLANQAAGEVEQLRAENARLQTRASGTAPRAKGPAVPPRAPAPRGGG